MVKVHSNMGIFAKKRLQVRIFLLNFCEIAIIITIIQKWHKRGAWKILAQKIKKKEGKQNEKINKTHPFISFSINSIS